MYTPRLYKTDRARTTSETHADLFSHTMFIVTIIASSAIGCAFYNQVRHFFKYPFVYLVEGEMAGHFEGDVSPHLPRS